MSDTEEDNTSTSSPSATTWPVTEQWLANVLRQHHGSPDSQDDIHIVEFTVRPGCDSSESVLSDIIAVNVEYRMGNDPQCSTTISRDLPQFVSFIIKLLPQDPFSRFFVTEAQFDLREIKFYTEVCPYINNFK